jgi:hypothetical protein
LSRWDDREVREGARDWVDYFWIIFAALAYTAIAIGVLVAITKIVHYWRSI